MGLLCGLAAGLLGGIPLHPEDGFLYGGKPDPRIVIVGVDDKSLGELGAYPFSRRVYGDAITKLNQDGAAAIGIDTGFVGPSSIPGDAELHQALVDSRIPVVLGYGESDLQFGASSFRMVGEDLAPYWQERCLDQSCSQPIPTVTLGATAVIFGSDGRAREAPLLARPQCYPATCSTPYIAAFGFSAYRALAGGSQSTLRQVPGGFSMPDWTRLLPTGSSSEFEIRYQVHPGAWRQAGRYFSLSDLVLGRVNPAVFAGKLVLIGADGATGLHDEVAVPGDSTLMPGVEVHANIVSMFLQDRFLLPENPLSTALAGLVLGMLVVIAVLGLPILATLPVLLVTAGGYSVLVMAAMREGVELNLVGVLGALLLAWAITVAYKLFLFERRRILDRYSAANLVGPDRGPQA